MKQSIFNALLQVKKSLVNSIINQDAFMREIALNTADEATDIEDQYLNEAYSYTITTIDDVTYCFEKNANEDFSVISRSTKDVSDYYEAAVNLSQIALDENISFENISVPSAPKIDVNFGDICNQVSIGENMNVLISNVNEKFLTSANVDTSDLINVVNNAINVPIDEVYQLKQQLLDASVDGKVSNFAWSNMLKNLTNFLGNSVEEKESVELDTSSPFAIQSFLNTVFKVLETVFETVMNLLVIALKGLFSIVALAISAITSLVKVVGSDRLKPDYDAPNNYVKGAICANNACSFNTGIDPDTQILFGDAEAEILEDDQILRFQNGCIDYYIWKEKFGDNQSHSLNINAYCSPTYCYSRFLLALAAWFNYDPLSIFNSRSVPSYNSGSYQFSGNVDRFIDFLQEYSDEFLTDPSSPTYIYLTGEELMQASIDSDFCTYAMWGSLLVHNFLRGYSIYFSGSDYVTIYPDNALYLNAGMWDFHLGSSGTISNTMSATAALTVISHGVACANIGASAFKFSSYQSSQLTSMCSQVRSMIQEIIEQNNSDNFIANTNRTNIATLSSVSTSRPYATGFKMYNTPIVQYYPLCSGWGDSTYSWLGIDILGQETPHPFFEDPDILDQLPAKGGISVPDFSTAEVIATMVAVAAVMVAAFVVKNQISKNLKARRQLKLSKRTEKLNSARELYNSDPKNEEYKNNYLKELKSYNKKAAFFGWPSYDAANGWMDYGSSSSAVATSATSLVNTMFDQYSNSKVTQDEVSDRSNEIINLIK
jgi:hypothetical protein